MKQLLVAFVLGVGLFGLLCFGLDQATAKAQAGRATAEASLEVTQTVGTQKGICTTTEIIAVPAGGTAYYCLTLRNIGSVPLSDYTIALSLTTSSQLITDTLTQPITLNPGDEVSLTTENLKALGTNLALETAGISSNIDHTIIVTATSSQGEVAVAESTVQVKLGTVQAKVTKTVGIDNSCAPTTGLAVKLEQWVIYCVTIQNTGSMALVNHQLRDPALNVDVEFGQAIPPSSQPYQVTDPILRSIDASQSLQHLTTQDITNTVTYTGFTEDGIVTTAQAQAVVVVGSISTAMTYTVGLDPNTCATTTNLALTVANTPFYYCIVLKNTGTLPLYQHTVTLPEVSQGQIITQTLLPGQVLTWTHTTIPQLQQTSIGTRQATVISRNRPAITTQAGPQQTQVTIGTLALSVIKYATKDPKQCVTQSPLTIFANEPFYYCVVLINNGSVPHVHYTFSEPTPFGINGAFDYRLEPGQRITLTNNFLTSTLGLSAMLGPFYTPSNVTSMNYPFTVVAYTANGASIQQAPFFLISVIQPTPTSTTAPTPVPTATPTPSFTPTETPIPSLTPTLTPVALSVLQTPATSLALNEVATPTAQTMTDATPNGAVDNAQPTSPLPPPVPTEDFTATAIAVAAAANATQTAIALAQPPTPSETWTPVPTEPVPTATVITATVVTATPDSAVIAPPPYSTLPTTTPAPVNDYLGVAAQVFEISAATLGWLWFLIGSIIFFAAAGMFAGLGIRYRDRHRYAMYDMDEEGGEEDDLLLMDDDLMLQPEEEDDDWTDDYWPESLR